MKLKIIKFEYSEDINIERIVNELLDIFNFSDFEINEEEPILECYDSNRSQYLASCLLKNIYKKHYEENSLILIITSKDLYEIGTNFVFGEAYIGEFIGIVSAYRLKFELEDRNHFYERLMKEILHEIGHALGLDHCNDINCVMHYSNNVLDIDAKGKFYCKKCAEKIKSYLKLEI